ncbi:xanthine dehydrogenase small subunit [Aliiroseovarius subalbicans]|uniref:xanthine dehydrogenase small subunit n=1 Tax=Aliiroseovarius subalbicans TaxID=2925840 RepID=UPI001F570D2F|nr:xanthine dehydrogenase small subunit [Aliiroseovarius subalbicans]MCI2400585.1 xanthine dehydrogenase small subunit [Aliiroseovarius subalbicans]
MDITFLLNGENVTLRDVDPTRTTLDWLREERGLRGSKEGCNEGDCGACTVMVTDAGGTSALNACILFLPQLHGKTLTTVEGLSGPDGALHPVQEALVTHHGSQCGFCTPGIAVSLAAGQLNGDTAHDDVLAGNLCRCTGYAPIIRAADAAAGAPVPDWLSTLRAGESPAASAEVGPALPDSSDALAHALMERPHATLVAGATDVGLWVTKGLRDLRDVIFLGGATDLQQIEVSDSDIRIGAGVTIAQLLPVMADHHPSFAEMLRRFASTQVRGAATLGGNIANGSPIGDSPPALIALGATLHLRRGDVRRDIRLQDFFIDYGKQDRVAGEFVEAISIPRQSDHLKVYKLSKRFDQDISAVLGAFNIVVEDGIVQSARIAFGGMAGIPKRATHVEQALTGQPWTQASVDAVGPAFAQDFTPMSDMRASAEYRLEAARNMLTRALAEDQGTPVSVLEVTP